MKDEQEKYMSEYIERNSEYDDIGRYRGEARETYFDTDVGMYYFGFFIGIIFLRRLFTYCIGKHYSIRMIDF